MAEAVHVGDAEAPGQLTGLMSDTIAALASGPPPSAIAVLRVSGPQAFAALAALLEGPLPPARRLSLRTLYGADSAVLDRAMVAVFPGPASASGEDLAELHLHGGPAVVADVLAALTALPGVRLAEPGEFTRRAFGHGRMDLSQVEGLADLVAAETSAQRQQALALAGGVLAQAADDWRQRCLLVLAEAEAGLDFAEEEADVAARLDEAARAALLAMADALAALVQDAGRAARIRDGLTIVVSGPPNVGKSSLINALSARDVAIVTPLAGTTRDVLEVPITLDGLAAVLIDTAGLRDTDDVIEAEGVRRARARASTADLVLQVGTPDAPPQAGQGLAIVNKCDLAPAGAWPGMLAVSALTGKGLPALRQALADWARQTLRPQQPALLAHARHRAAFAEAEAQLRAAADASEPVLRAEALRQAAFAFGRIAGRVGVDDVLDVIFSRFCIGK